MVRRWRVYDPHYPSTSLHLTATTTLPDEVLAVSRWIAGWSGTCGSCSCGYQMPLLSLLEPGLVRTTASDMVPLVLQIATHPNVLGVCRSSTCLNWRALCRPLATRLRC